MTVQMLSTCEEAPAGIGEIPCYQSPVFILSVDETHG